MVAKAPLYLRTLSEASPQNPYVLVDDTSMTVARVEEKGGAPKASLAAFSRHHLRTAPLSARAGAIGSLINGCSPAAIAWSLSEWFLPPLCFRV